MDDTKKDQLKGELRSYVESITRKSKSNLYVCPLCHSGEGPNGTGAFGIYAGGLKWKCQACKRGGDIFDLIGEYEGIQDKLGQLRRAGEIFGVDTSRGSSAREDFGKVYQNQPKNEQYTHDSIHTSAYTQTGEPWEDFTSFYLEAHKHIDETDYPLRRGLSRETIDRFKLGYVAEWKTPLEAYLRGGDGRTRSGKPRTRESWEYIPGTPRLIIPISKYSYLARATRPEDEPQKSKAKGKDKVSWTFNAQALQTATRPVFVVEGELDALSIIEVGGEAVALGSINYIRAFTELLKVRRPAQPLILALDNEKEPEKRERIEQAYRELEDGLSRLDIPFYRYNPCGEYKDANEALQRDREALRQAVEEAENIPDEAEQAEREAYLQTSTAHYLQDFVDGITDSVNTPAIPTGFRDLDKALDGGLYEGLYIVGAISSLGKTTLITQIADQIAQSGRDVLIFSLEMARNEIIAKSISRHTIQLVLETGGSTRNAKTSRGITTGKRYEGYSQTELELINSSIVAYSQYAERIFISEGVGDIGVEQIRETIRKHITFTGHTPVVVIDYLQILAPYNERFTDKQNTDKAVMELKRISRDYKTPVIGISSFNRANYREAVTMEAFKESGAIEYSSDVLIGLQLKGAGEKGFNASEEKKKDPRAVELVILKNRNGSTGDRIDFRYYPLFNYFKEASED